MTTTKLALPSLWVYHFHPALTLLDLPSPFSSSPDTFKIINPQTHILDDGTIFPFVSSTDLLPEWPDELERCRAKRDDGD